MEHQTDKSDNSGTSETAKFHPPITTPAYDQLHPELPLMMLHAYLATRDEDVGL